MLWVQCTSTCDIVFSTHAHVMHMVRVYRSAHCNVLAYRCDVLVHADVSGYDIAFLIPMKQEVIEGVVSREIALKFLSFDLKAFVDTNPNIRWCPHPGCSQAVHKQAPTSAEDHISLSPTHSPNEGKGRTVNCGHEHYFCWDCVGEAHEPCTCVQWQMWLEHVEVMKVRVGETTASEADEAASSRWLVDYSKPCPKCKYVCACGTGRRRCTTVASFISRAIIVVCPKCV